MRAVIFVYDIGRGADGESEPQIGRVYDVMPNDGAAPVAVSLQVANRCRRQPEVGDAAIGQSRIRANRTRWRR